MAVHPSPQKEIPQALGEIAQGPTRFEQFLDRNQKNLIMLTVGVAVAVAGFIVYQGVATGKEHGAGADFCEADDLAALQNVIKEFGGTAAAGSATIALADRQWDEGQWPKAVETLVQFIDAKPKHPAIPAAKASLAAKYKQREDIKEATRLYQELTDDPAAAYLAPYAFICLGDLAKEGGDLAKAESFYHKSKTSLLNNAFTSISDERLATLKTALPVEIAPLSPEELAVPALLRRPREDGEAAAPAVEAAPSADDLDIPEMDITNPPPAPESGLPFGGLEGADPLDGIPAAP